MSAPHEVRLKLAGRFGGFDLDSEAAFPGSGVTALVGPSGAGKTTLLRCLAGLARAEGTVTVGETVWQDAKRFVAPHRRGVGYVFQEPSLLPHLSVRQNLGYAARRAPADAEGPSLDEVVEMLGLADLLPRGIQALSGGERQRVAIGRALLSKPVLLLMDEPLSSLDAASKAEVMPYLEELHRRLRLPVLYVSHDAGEVARLADRVIRMANGRLDADEAPAVARDPLALMSEAQIRGLAHAALAVGLRPPPDWEP
ncbi:MAG: ATP-binding cassette domain-containing protein [Phenylobacterium sp.]|nr:MAG: ATP-binding cassette domain-containing protein [Phenylobacterium sp.]